MKLAMIQDIIVEPERQRVIFDQEKLADLAVSMETYGLLHPIVVRETSEGKLTLLAGERRLRAAQFLKDNKRHILNVPWGMVPYNTLGEVDGLTAKSIELEENIRRVDLTWQELAKATSELHKLRQTENPHWLLKDTMQEIKELGGGSLPSTTVRNRILLAEHMETMPELKKAANETAAVKEMTRALEQQFRRVLAERMQTAEGDKFQLFNKDAVEGMRELEAESVDLILTDPPYGIDATEFNIDTVTEVHNYSDDWGLVKQLLEDSIKEMTRVAKPQCHLYMFCDYRHLEEITSYLEENEWVVWNRPLLWVKNTGYCPKPDYGPRRHYECIIFANKGKKMVNLVASDVIICPAVVDKVHAAEKPVAVLANLIKRSTMAGDTILDPFAGSGSIFDAAYEHGCNVIAFEKDAATFQIAFDRKEKFADA